MADANILQEFLVRIGFQLDQDQVKRLQNNLAKTKGWIEDLGEATGAASYLIERNVTRVAETFDRLYYASARIGTSVKSLQAYQFGAQMIGVSAEQATAQLEGLKRSLRDNPGTGAFLNSMGIKTAGRETADVADDLLDRMAKMQPFMRAQVGSMFGMDSDTINQMVMFRQQMKEAQAERRKMQQDAGLDPDKLARQSAQFQRESLRLHTDIDILEQLIAERFLPAADMLVRGLTKVFGFAGRADKATHGASTYAGVGVGIFGAALLKRRAVRWFKNLGGKKGAGAGTEAAEGAEVAEGAGVATEAAAGAGAAADVGVAGEGIGAAVAFGTGVGEAAAVVAAVLAVLGLSIYELHKHWDQIQHTSDSVRDWADKKLAAAGHAIAGEAKWEAHALASAGRSGAAKVEGWASKGLDWFTKHSEGLRLQAYPDAGGYSIGYGHHLRKGEHYTSITQAQADALYTQDRTIAQNHVRRLVAGGAKLNQGQMDALADFEFNTGGLAGSKLLGMVRSGRFADAAKEFERWDHVHRNGKVVEDRNLLSRRLGEESMFRGGGASITMKTDIHVTGSGDPHGTARNVARLQGDVASNMVRNVRGVPQ